MPGGLMVAATNTASNPAARMMLAPERSVLPGEGVAESLAHQVKAGVPVRLCLSPAITSPTTLDGILLRRSRRPAMPTIFRFDTMMLV